MTHIITVVFVIIIIVVLLLLIISIDHEIFFNSVNNVARIIIIIINSPLPRSGFFFWIWWKNVTVVVIHRIADILRRMIRGENTTAVAEEKTWSALMKMRIRGWTTSLTRTNIIRQNLGLHVAVDVETSSTKVVIIIEGVVL